MQRDVHQLRRIDVGSQQCDESEHTAFHFCNVDLVIRIWAQARPPPPFSRLPAGNNSCG